MKQNFSSKLFISCASGLEPLLTEEIQSLGFKDVETGFRGVYVPISDFSAIYRINYCSRIASRVLLPLMEFRCFDQKSLYKAADKIDWLKFIPPGKTFAIDANVTHRELRNSLFAAQVVKDAICDQFRARIGTRPNVDVQNPDVQLNLFIHDNHGVISFDTSGAPLHKRGYRQETVEAPMQESLAAAILISAKYTGEEILFDPCCGSGTLLIEAALIATKTPPGFLRPIWGFMYLPEFSQNDWLIVKNEADSKRGPLKKNIISGMDINKNSVRSSKINLRAAGFSREIEIHQGDFRDYTSEPMPNFIVTNPPHGKRLDDVEYLKPLYRALGDFMKRKTAKPGRGWIFSGNLDLSKEVGLAADRRIVLTSGGVECRLLGFDLY
jgi:putative N6-adenine-specific DNA methylase